MLLPATPSLRRNFLDAAVQDGAQRKLVQSDAQRELVQSGVQRKVVQETVLHVLATGVIPFTLCTLLATLYLLGIPSIAMAQAASPADGANWTNFANLDGPITEEIYSLYTDDAGYLWVGTVAGASVRTPDGQWLTLTMDDGLAGNRISAIVTDPTNPHYHWFATNGGASLLDDGGALLDQSKHRWMTFGKRDGILDHRLSSVTVAPNGEVWFGLSYFEPDLDVRIGNGISVLDPHGTPFDKSDDTWRSFTAANSHLSTDVIHKLYTDAAGIIWIATQSGLNAYQNEQWMLFSMEQGLPANDITTVQVTGQQLWIGTTNGFGLLDHGGTLTTATDDRWLTYPLSATLSSNVSALGVDGNGYLWSGLYPLVSQTSSSGLLVRDLNGTPFDVGDDTLSSISWETITYPKAMTVEGEDSWFAASGGIYHLNYTGSPLDAAQQQWRNDTVGNGFAGYTVSAVAPLGSSAMLVAYDGQPLVLQHNFTPQDLHDDHWLYAGVGSGSIVATDHLNRFWVGSGVSLAVIDPGASLTSDYDDQGRIYDDLAGLKMATINAIVVDDENRAWIANGDFFGGGLNLLSAGESVSEAGDDQMATFTVQNSGLPGSFVTALAVGLDHDLWVGTTTGAAHLRYGPSPFRKQDDVWTTYTTANSDIAANHIRGIALDAAGNAWFALATGGISVHTTSDEWVTFSEADGLVFNAVNAVAVDLDGNLWFGTDGEGISVLDTAGTIADKSDDQWTTVPAETPLLSGYIRAITVDANGQIWVGTFGGGLSLYSTVDFQHNYLPLMHDGYRYGYNYFYP